MGEQIKKFRTEHGITQEELAIRTGFSVGYLSNIENGHKSPSFTAIQKISNALNISPSVLMDDADAIPLSKYINHLPEELQKFVSNPKNEVWIELAKGISVKDITPEEAKEVFDFVTDFVNRKK